MAKSQLNIVMDPLATSRCTHILIFSKDRAMQLDSCLSSLFSTCIDAEKLDISVLYKASDIYSEAQYRTLGEYYTEINFFI